VTDPFRYLAYKYLWTLPVFAGLAISHPLTVIGMQVMYAPHHTKISMQKDFSNVLKTARNIKKHMGNQGYWRGFVPSIMISVCIYFDDLKELFKS